MYFQCNASPLSVGLPSVTNPTHVIHSRVWYINEPSESSRYFDIILKQRLVVRQNGTRILSSADIDPRRILSYFVVPWNKEVSVTYLP